MKQWILSLLFISPLLLTAEIPWGTEKSHGLVTRLVPSQASFASGSPITFRLELKNIGDVPSDYDDQGISWRDNIAITGPNGKTHPFFGSIAQSTGGDRPLAPGATVVLFDERDLAPDYAISPTETGTYTFQFRGATMYKNRIPASNTVTIKIAGGTVNPLNELLIAIHAGLDHKEWFISKNEAGRDEQHEFNQISLRHNPTGLKKDIVFFNLYQSQKKLSASAKEKLEVDQPFYTGAYGQLTLKGDKRAWGRFPKFSQTITAHLKRAK